MHATQSRRNVKRTVSVVETNGPWFLLEVTTGKRTDYYIVWRVAACFGTAAFQLEKQDGTIYNVLLDLESEEHGCDCPAGCNADPVRKDGQPPRDCKHVAGLLALHDTGKLPKPIILPRPKTALRPDPKPAA